MEVLLNNHGLNHIGQQIFGYLDFKTLLQCYSVCKLWRHFIDFCFEDFTGTELVLRLHKLKTKKKAFISKLGIVQDLYCVLEGFPTWFTVFHYFENTACYIDFKQFLDFFESYFHDPSVQYDFSPLHYAVRTGDLRIVKLILQSPADVNETNDSAETPLHLACYHGYFEIVKYLMKKNIYCNSGNKFGDTPLHYAIEQGHVKIVKTLIDHERINVNIQAVDGNTPLQLACLQGNEEMVKLFLSAQKVLPKFEDCDLPYKYEIRKLFEGLE